MANKFTVAQIKDILNRAGDRSGYAFDKFGPYFANAGRLKAMKSKFQEIIDAKSGDVSDRQKRSIIDWFAFLSDRYGI